MFLEQFESLGDVLPLLASKLCARILVFDSPRGLPGSSLAMDVLDDADLVSKSLVRSFALLEHLDLNITRRVSLKRFEQMFKNVTHVGGPDREKQTARFRSILVQL